MSIDDGVCAIEAYNWLRGKPHSDNYKSAVIGMFVRMWNDAMPTDEDREILKPLVLALLAANGPIDASHNAEQARGLLVTDWYCRHYMPAWLDIAGLSDHAKALRDFPPLESWDDVEKITPLLQAAQSAVWSASNTALDKAADSVGDSIAGKAAWISTDDVTVGAAWDATEVTACGAACRTAENAARAAARRKGGNAAKSVAKSTVLVDVASAASSAARVAARRAAENVARDAARSAVEQVAESSSEGVAWNAAWDAAESAAKSAAESALAPTVAALQASAVDLVMRLIAVKPA